MTLPRKITCEACGDVFETTVAGQTMCNSCLTKPSAPEPLSDGDDCREVQDSGKGPRRNFPERVCACGARYLPTSGSQKHCPLCIEKERRKRKRGSRGGTVSPQTLVNKLKGAEADRSAGRYPGNVASISARSGADKRLDQVVTLVGELLNRPGVASVIVALRKE